MTIKETEHFIAKTIDVKDIARIDIKNVDGTAELFALISDADVEIKGKMLQDCITSWELFSELVLVLDEISDYVAMR